MNRRSSTFPGGALGQIPWLLFPAVVPEAPDRQGPKEDNELPESPDRGPPRGGDTAPGNAFEYRHPPEPDQPQLNLEIFLNQFGELRSLVKEGFRSLHLERHEI